LAGSRDFFLSLPASYSMETGILARVKAVVCEAAHSHPYRAEVKNVWSHTPSLPTCTHGVDRDDFTFSTKFLWSV